MTITTGDAKTYTSKKFEKSKRNFEESQQFRVFTHEDSYKEKAKQTNHNSNCGKKLDSSQSISDQDDYDGNALANIKEDSRENEAPSERKESLMSSGVESNIIDSGLYSKPFALSNDDSNMETMAVSSQLKLYKKPSEFTKIHLSKQKAATTDELSPNEVLDNCGSVVQKIENLLNKRLQRKNKTKYPKSLHKIGQLSSSHDFREKKSEVKSGAELTSEKKKSFRSSKLAFVDQSFTKDRPKRSRSSSASNINANNRLFQPSASHIDSFSKTLNSKRKQSISSAHQKIENSPRHWNAMTPKANDHVWKKFIKGMDLISKSSISKKSANDTRKSKGPSSSVLNTIQKQDLQTNSREGSKLNLSERNISATKRPDLTLTQQQADKRPKTLLNITPTCGQIQSSIPVLSETLGSSRSRYCASGIIKPKRISELKEETQKIINKLTSKKNKKSNQGSDECQSFDTNKFEEVSLMEGDNKDMSNSLFSANIMMLKKTAPAIPNSPKSNVISLLYSSKPVYSGFKNDLKANCVQETPSSPCSYKQSSKRTESAGRNKKILERSFQGLNTCQEDDPDLGKSSFTEFKNNRPATAFMIIPQEKLKFSTPILTKKEGADHIKKAGTPTPVKTNSKVSTWRSQWRKLTSDPKKK